MLLVDGGVKGAVVHVVVVDCVVVVGPLQTLVVAGAGGSGAHVASIGHRCGDGRGGGVCCWRGGLENQLEV